MFSIKSYFLHLTYINFNQINDNFINVFAIKFKYNNLAHDFDEKKNIILI